MAMQTVAHFVEVLRKQPLLEPAHKEQLAQLIEQFPEPKTLARELIQRGWLTPYQINQIFQERSQDLVLGPYVIQERVGEGGMGAVFKARHQRLSRTVALKVIRKHQMTRADSSVRFQREARAAAQLTHPNIVLVFDSDQSNGTHYLAMEYVEGIDLARLVKQSGPLPIGQACDYIRQAALGLQHAHDNGLVHRDIKPSNLVVTRKNPGETPVVKILDFGLARFTSETTEDGQLTDTGQVMGTPDYIAPEQAHNTRSADIRADIFSLGCSLFYLLTGQVPFPGENVMEKLAARISGQSRSVWDLRPEVPPALATIISKMIAMKPADRYQLPSEAAEVLAPYCDHDADYSVPFAAALHTQATLPTLPSNNQFAETLQFQVKKILTHPQRKYIAAGTVIGMLLFGFLVMSIFSGPKKTTPPPDDTAQVKPPPKDEKPDIYKDLKISNARLGKGPYKSGDVLTFSFDLVNNGSTEIAIPADKSGKRTEYPAGIRQSWVERLGDDPTIPIKGRRQGRKYAVGAESLLVDAAVPVGKTYRYSATLRTDGFAAGVYFYSIEFKKPGSDAVQTETVEFELRPGTVSPEEERRKLHDGLIGQRMIPLEAAAWINGKPLTPQDLKGKVVLLDFWAMWCPPCVAIQPTLRRWSETYEKDGLVVVSLTRYFGVTWDANGKRAKRVDGLSPKDEEAAHVQFAKYYNLHHRVGLMPIESDLDQRYGVTAIPQMVLIDRDGKIRLIRVGATTANLKLFEDTIKQLLADPVAQ